MKKTNNISRTTYILVPMTLVIEIRTTCKTNNGKNNKFRHSQNKWYVFFYLCLSNCTDFFVVETSLKVKTAMCSCSNTNKTHTTYFARDEIYDSLRHT